jgi:hypothetical protein
MRPATTAARLTTAAVAALMLAGCSTSVSTTDSTPATSGEQTTVPSVPVTATDTGTDTTATGATGAKSEFVAEVWADNWFSLYVNGKLVGQDSVPITTERSFNSETISFTATYPLTIAMVTKDFKQDDSGLEYIGTDRQQMGDGGFIAQITDRASGRVIARTGTDWKGLVIHRAPLDDSCEKSASPATDCASKIVAEPSGWTSAGFDDATWAPATTYSGEEVGVKEGYNDISWDPSARLIWTSSLTKDNTILWRHTVTSP